MTAVRVFLALALAVHLSGVPAIAQGPCAAGAAGAHACCIRHQTETGGPVIGHCGCPVPHGADGGTSGVTTSAPVPGGVAPDAVAAAVPPVPTPASSAGPSTADASLSGPSPGPPHLSGSGFRC
jgi:hypothetical protein